MQLEFGNIDIFSLEPVDECFRNFSKKVLNFKEAIEEQKTIEKDKGASRDMLRTEEAQHILGEDQGKSFGTLLIFSEEKL